MSMILKITGSAIILIFIGVSLMSFVFFRNKKQAGQEWSAHVPERLSDFGSVERLTILPLIDWYAEKDHFIEEPGVSWLIQADRNSILLDMGITREQAIVVNVAGKGLVLIAGCGHQGVEKIFKRAEAVFDEPVFAFVGGLHSPVTESRMKILGLPVQKLMSTGKLPWQKITRDEVEESIEFLKSKNLGLISISAHDSCDWTLSRFSEAFKGIYKELKVGLPITI